MKQNVEFRIIDAHDMPPLVISQNENDEPKVVINTYHKLWISLNRRTIAGIIEALQEKMDMILTSYLEEQYNFELQDRIDLKEMGE
jgi:hypothetical protein|tara:strand:- start:551 stop:808 length:258 start_codon:yes stop_codon:yes gene_type:complete